MIPEFPDFKKLEIEDKPEFEMLVSKMPHYSDFDFVSIWSWDTNKEMAISKLNDNLVIKFSDYLTGEPFFFFVGLNRVNETASEVLKYSPQKEIEPRMKLVPEEIAMNLDKDTYFIEEDRDNFDYIFSIENLSKFEGPEHKNIRNMLSRFNGHAHKTEIKEMDLRDPENQKRVLSLYRDWERNKGYIVPQEAIALNRLFEQIGKFELITIGIFLDDKLIGFTINSICNKHICNCIFSKADIEFKGIYAFLMNATGIKLHEKGYQLLNFEQDLGIFNLKKAKEAYFPIKFMKKYYVRFKDSD